MPRDSSKLRRCFCNVLRGRVVVAHNVQFDWRFLDAEFARMDLCLPELSVMCTMQLAAQCLRGLPARSLAACCLAAGIPLDGAHAAAVDARVVARLLACYVRADNRLAAQWARMAADAALVPWPALPPLVAQLVTRKIVAYNRAHEVPFLARPGAAALPGREQISVSKYYLAVLDTVLEDRRVTATEAESLQDLAASLGGRRGGCYRRAPDVLAGARGRRLG